MTQSREQADPRRCLICSTSLAGLRSDARYCSKSHRTEASRIRRLLAGEKVGRYESLARYLDRPRRRAQGA